MFDYEKDPGSFLVAKYLTRWSNDEFNIYNWADSAWLANRLRLLGITYLVGENNKLLFHGPLAEQVGGGFKY